MLKRDRSGREHGAVAISTVVFMIALGALLALGINVGHMMKVRNQLQNRVDSAALAGAMELNGLQSGIDAAPVVAREYVTEHLTDNNDNPNDDTLPQDIETGIWDFDARTFTASTDPSHVNAVRVSSYRTSGRNTPLSVFFGPFLGATEANALARAVAVGGSPCESCAFPLVYAACQTYTDWPTNTQLACPDQARPSNNNSDKIGFTIFGDGMPNPAAFDNLIDPATCPKDPHDPSRCCVGASVGDVIGIQNGADLTRRTKTREMIARYIGQQVTVPIVIPAGCEGGNPTFNRETEIIGFAEITITAIDEVSVTITQRCDEESSEVTIGGCNSYFLGTWAPYTRLVQ